MIVVKAAWGIFNNTNRSLFTRNSLLVIYKSQYYSINDIMQRGGGGKALSDNRATVRAGGGGL